MTGDVEIAVGCQRQAGNGRCRQDEHVRPQSSSAGSR
jgi:hypothetical protein